jgi:AICAR transformylase/IMP cyclohydrolase PurH
LPNLTLTEPAAAVLKHTNPCGVAVGSSLADAYEKALNADSISAFGGIVALNQPLDGETAEKLTKTFLECVVDSRMYRGSQGNYQQKIQGKSLIVT